MAPNTIYMSFHEISFSKLFSLQLEWKDNWIGQLRKSENLFKISLARQYYPKLIDIWAFLSPIGLMTIDEQWGSSRANGTISQWQDWERTVPCYFPKWEKKQSYGYDRSAHLILWHWLTPHNGHLLHGHSSHFHLTFWSWVYLSSTNRLPDTNSLLNYVIYCCLVLTS